MNDTPITDELEHQHCNGSGVIDYARLRNEAMQHARRLERDRARLMKLLAALAATYGPGCEYDNPEADEARKLLRELEAK